jgi:vacuolar-type H+-ATPase subunit E/Vma4
MSDSTEALVQQILQDARARSEPLCKRAEREAEEIIRRAAEEAAAQRDQILQRARHRVEVNAQRVRAQTALQAANIMRNAREQILLEVRRRAEERLRELVTAEDYPRMLVRLSSAAIQMMSGRHFELVMRPEDRETHGERVVSILRDYAARELNRQIVVKVAGETITARGGLLVRTADGRQLCDQTFSARLDRLWGQLREEVGRQLFPD